MGSYTLASKNNIERKYAMENLSDKAKIVYATLKMLGAEGSENR